MTLQQLEYIIALQEYGNFTRAADACGVTQPTISTMIQRLEAELGVAIFDRTRQPVVATDVGENIIAQAKVVLGEASKMDALVQEQYATLQGELNIAFLPTIAPFLIPKLLPSWKKTFNGLTINIKELKTQVAYDKLLRRELDVAVVASEPESDALRSRVLYYEEFLGYIPPSNKLYKEPLLHSGEISVDELWLLSEGHCFRTQLENFCKLKEESHAAISYAEGSLMGFMHMVEEGEGITFIPSLAKAYLSEEQLKMVRSFTIPRPIRAIQLVWHKDYVRHTLLNKLEETIKRAVPKEMLTIAPGQKLAK